MTLCKALKLALVFFAYFSKTDEAANSFCSECCIEFGGNAVAIATFMGILTSELLK